MRLAAGVGADAAGPIVVGTLKSGGSLLSRANLFAIVPFAPPFCCELQPTTRSAPSNTHLVRHAAVGTTHVTPTIDAALPYCSRRSKCGRSSQQGHDRANELADTTGDLRR